MRGGSHTVLTVVLVEQLCQHVVFSVHCGGLNSVSQLGAVKLPVQPPRQLTSTPQLSPCGGSILHNPSQVPLQLEEHLPWQFGSLSVRLPSAEVQVPLHAPVQVASHCPIQLAGRSGLPSQNADALQLPEHCTLSDPGSHRVSMLPESQTFWVLQMSSHVFCCSKSGRQTP